MSRDGRGASSASGVAAPAYPWRRILDELCIPNGSDRTFELDTHFKEHLEMEQRTRSADSFAGLVRTVLQGIRERLEVGGRSLAGPKPQPAAKDLCLGSLAALDQLLDVKGIFDSLPDKPDKLPELLEPAFGASSYPSVVEHAARTLGHFLRVGGPLTADAADKQVRQAIRELTGSRKLAAAMKLRYLAEDVCAIFNVHVRDFIANIWEGLRDKTTKVREASVQALRACLMLVEARETRYRVQWYYRLFEETQRGLSKPPCTLESIHGSLMALGELLRHTGEFMLARYKEVVETVLRFRDSKDKQIRRAVISLIPRLAAFAPRRFAFRYLKTGVEYLITTLKVKEEKGAGFLAIADVALALGAAGCQTQMEPYLIRIAEHIQDAIAYPRKGKALPCPEALRCAGALAKALGEIWKPYATPLVEQMILTGLNLELIKALQATVDAIPELTQDIQDWLLDLLCLCLSGQPNRATLGSRAKEALVQALHVGVASPPGAAMPDLRQVRLALFTLGSFDFGHRRMLGIVETCVLPYMQHERESVRKVAAVAAVQLLQRRLTFWQQHPNNIPAVHHVRTVETVVNRLLTAACADVEAGVRRCILGALQKSTALDTYLAQADCLRALFVALNDEERVVRGLAIMVVGRLALHNPAYVMPALRRHLMQLLNDMNTAQDYSQREESAQLLGCLIKACPRLVLPYVPPVLKALLNKLREVTKPPPYANNPLQLLGKQAASGESSVAATVLATTGELARVAGPALRPHMVELLKPIIDAIQDTTSMHKSLTAVSTLGQVVESTGVVVSPYMEHPQLLSLLLRILTDGTPHARMEVIKVVGIIGALDPHTHKLNQAKLSGEGKLEEEGVRPQRQGPPPAHQTGAMQLGTLGSLMGDAYTELLPASGMLSNNEEYYPTVALNALMNALRNPAAAAHQAEVFNAMFTILKSLGLASVPYLPKVMPEVLRHLHCGMEATRRNQLLEMLTQMVQQLRQHMRRWLSDIVQLTTDFWDPSDPILTDTLLSLHGNLAVALRDDMRTHLPTLLPKYIALLGEAERSGVYNLVPPTLRTLECLEAALEEHMQLLLPALVHLMDPGVIVTPPPVRSRALLAMRRLLPRMALAGSTSAVLHPLLRVLDGPDNTLRKEALDTICALSIALGPDFSLFVHTIRKIVARHGLRHTLFDKVASRLANPEPPCMSDSEDWESCEVSLKTVLPEEEELPVPPVDAGPPGSYTVTAAVETTLKRAWESSQRSTKEDWDEWMRNFAVELLHYSSSPALGATWALAQSHPAMARDLFPAAFVCCWSGLSETMQDALVRSLEAALASPTIPAEIVTALLNLAEFMEHDEKSLPLDTRTLGALAEKCHAFAKALHYKELEFATSPETAVEALISINNQLRQPEAARGILTHARTVLHMELKESWYEKLGRWEEALEAYDRKLASWEGKYNSLVAGSAAHLEATLGRLRCLAALAEWERLSVLCAREWRRQEALVRRDMAAIAAHAAWHMGDWDSMSTYTATLKDTQESPAARLNGEFLSGVLRAHLQDWEGALKHVTSARELLGTELAALVSESYERAYIDVVRAQQLAELEEVIHYSQALRAADGDEVAAEAKRSLIRQVWRGRLKGVQRNVEVWQALLSVRTLVLPMHEDTHTWLKFASLCRKSGRVKQSMTTLHQLLQYDPVTRRPGDPGYGAGSTAPDIMFGFLKHQWMTGADRQDVLNRLEDLRRENTLLSGNGASSSFVMMQPQSPVAHARSPMTTVYGQMEGYNPPLSARIHLRSALWRWGLAQQDLNEDAIDRILAALDVATREAPNWGKAWHNYALFNVTTLEHWSNAGDRQRANSYVAPAVKGFFSSIAIGQMTGNTRGSNLQDILRLLTLWFSHGEADNVKQALQEGFAHVSVDTWLVVIPQIIARIHTTNSGVRHLIHGLLTRIGRHHPQALIYPLLVACKSQSEGRRDAAMRVLNNLRIHSPTLVEQAQLVSQELIRMAILWHEMWHEALEEASRQYFGENNVQAMMDTLFPLHRMMEAGPPTTLKEIAFVQAYGKELEEAYDSCKKYQASGKESELHQAWDLYYHVFKRINKQLPSLVTLDLQYVAPALIRAQSLELAVPGTYIAGEPLVTIAAFAPQLHVITSKQRPRKLTISGSDGAEYMFLLKGHEDLRQDERVMQLFGLVNNMLANDRITAEHGLSIARYAVIPLSPNSGLIGWVPNCDTLHTLIREFRDTRKVPLNVEHRLMLGMAPDYDMLTVIQKVEVFEHALESTSGDDLHKVLWLKSRNSEVWLERRTFYTRSTAVMSMVGYLLGLGDRHPSNLMLDRYSGKLLHIDFGDCFEASMHREKFPEKVPFRLTRMMVKAMEVSGIEGNFRFTCEHVMRVLRANKDSVMAMLEAFVHDPLINWRLLNHADADAPEHPDTAPTTPHNDMSLQSGNLDDDENSEYPANLPARGQREQETLRDFQNLEGNANEVLNERAVVVMKRMSDKLTGRDWMQDGVAGAAESGVESQVSRLIVMATSHENLCQSYIGWCPFW